MKLSICVVTMNRAPQLSEALDSCLKCELPEDTQFVIIDNASTDDTESLVCKKLNNSNYKFYYEKMSENLGVGKGRNYAFQKADGDYFYMLDDDAVIDYENCPDFFKKAVMVFEDNPKIATLTTQIYDTCWKINRVDKWGREVLKGVYMYHIFCGGSHFLRKSFFEQPPYLSNRYGYEELPPSLMVVDKGCYNVAYPELLVIHKPVGNRFDWSSEENHPLLIKGITMPYAIKSAMYPILFRPFLYGAYLIRRKQSLSHIRDYKRRARNMINEVKDEYSFGKLPVKTILKLISEFGLSAF